ncbi:MAG TPA: hemolysin family protein [Desulfurivibrionaceae bacterium]|nr:hemolysin family protein [Desulfurivibrionaceae bacterium]
MLTHLIIAVGCAMSISAMCSLFEAALYSVPLSHVEVLAQNNKLSGRLLKKLKQEIHKPIAAILTLNTIANTAGAAVAGAMAAAVFGEANLIWFSAAFTVGILLFSEILPKTIGVGHSKALAPWIALPIHGMVTMLSPLLWLIHVVTKLAGAREQELLVSAEEVQAIARLSRKAGEIDTQEERVITNVLELRHKQVRQAMTPRTVTFCLNAHLTVAEAKEFEKKWNFHSRVPVYDKNPDDVVGIVLRKDVLLCAAADKEETTLRELMQPVHFVPESARLTPVLLDFLEKRSHLFVVVDEYGSFTGVISLEDVIEELVGREIIDESDQARDMRELARKKRGTLLNQLVDLKDHHEVRNQQRADQ